jgi:hypothetical protein
MNHWGIRAALSANPSLEARRRMTDMLAKPRPAVLSPEALRGVRGVQVLEMIANPEARKVLAVLAGGAAGARLTQEAQASLERPGAMTGMRGPTYWQAGWPATDLAGGVADPGGDRSCSPL